MMGKAEYDRARALVDVAFNNNIEKICKKSFCKTIDVQLGVYQGEGEYKGWLTISLKPSKGLVDWLINIFGFLIPVPLDFGYVHGLYWKEVIHYWPEFIALIHTNKALADAMDKGVLIAGRSKGGAEAVLVGYRMWYPGLKMEIAPIESPRFCSYWLARAIERRIGKKHIHYTVYRNDIVPGLFKWLMIPGVKHQIGERTNGLSIKDHQQSTQDESIFYDEIERLYKEG